MLYLHDCMDYICPQDSRQCVYVLCVVINAVIIKAIILRVHLQHLHNYIQRLSLLEDTEPILFRYKGCAYLVSKEGCTMSLCTQFLPMMEVVDGSYSEITQVM